MNLLRVGMLLLAMLLFPAHACATLELKLEPPRLVGASNNSATHYWFPTDMSDQGKIAWNLSSGDISIIEGKLKEIEGYEEFHEVKPDEDPEEDYQTIRRNREINKGDY